MVLRLSALFRSWYMLVGGIVAVGWTVATHAEAYRKRVRTDSALVATEGSDQCYGHEHRTGNFDAYVRTALRYHSAGGVT